MSIADTKPAHGSEAMFARLLGLAHKVRASLADYHAHEPDWSVGQCRSATDALTEILRHAGYDARPYGGYYLDCDEGYPDRAARAGSEGDVPDDWDRSWKHWWVVCEGFIVDVTADQFHAPSDRAFKDVVVVEFGDPSYSGPIPPGKDAEPVTSQDDEIAIQGEIEWLYHGTTSSSRDGILENGLRAGTCWGTYEMARHFAKVECKQSGGRPVLFARRLSAFDVSTLEPDSDAVDFPMTEVFGSSYDVLGERWDQGPQGWEECFRLYRSLKCSEPVMMTREHILKRGETVPVIEPEEPCSVRFG